MTVTDLYADHAAAVLACLRQHAHRDAIDDLSQAVWLRATVAVNEGRFDGRYPRGWLCTIARNLAKNWWRDYRRHHDPLVSIESGVYTTPTASEEHSRDARIALSELAPRLRRLKPAEQAAIRRVVLDLPQAGVPGKAALYRARKVLRGERA